MTSNDRLAPDIEIYLQRLTWALGPLPEPDRVQIALEIRGHLAERAAQGEDALYAAFRQLGAPHELARAYVEDYELSGALNRAAPRDLLVAVLARGSRSLLAFALGTIASVLYLLAPVLALVALAKPFVPNSVGAWMGASGLKTVGIASRPPAGAVDVLGYWIVPLALVAAVSCYIVATGLLRHGARRLLRPSAPRFA